MFRDVRRFWRVSSKSPRIRSSDGAGDVHPVALARALSRASSDSADEPTTAFGTYSTIFLRNYLFQLSKFLLENRYLSIRTGPSNPYGPALRVMAHTP